MLNTQVDVQSEVLAEYASTSVTVAAEVGSIHISSASALRNACGARSDVSTDPDAAARTHALPKSVRVGYEPAFTISL